MAIFGKLEVLENQVDNKKFKIAFEYLRRVMKEGTVENNRLFSLSLNAFEKINLDEYNFGLEQVYNSKNREDCFFESHKQYIDIQLIVKGQEIIEVSNINALIVNSEYNEEMDLIKYKTIDNASTLILQEGDIAIFYPQDAHMPCVKLTTASKVVKTVVKVSL